MQTAARKSIAALKVKLCGLQKDVTCGLRLKTQNNKKDLQFKNSAVLRLFSKKKLARPQKRLHTPCVGRALCYMFSVFDKIAHLGMHIVMCSLELNFIFQDS